MNKKIRVVAFMAVCFFLAQGISFAGMSACKARINKKYVTVNRQRDELSQAYIREHYGIDASDAHILPVFIVVHWTAINNLKSSYRVFQGPTIARSRRELVKASALNVGAQFLVDRDGEIYQLLPVTYFARHVIGLNYFAIGIENVGGPKQGLTRKQLLANETLVRCLVNNYPDIKYLIGHYEYREFESTPYFLEKDPSYRTRKQDPGVDFMKKLRRRVSDLYKTSRLLNIKEGK